MVISGRRLLVDALSVVLAEAGAAVAGVVPYGQITEELGRHIVVIDLEVPGARTEELQRRASAPGVIRRVAFADVISNEAAALAFELGVTSFCSSRQTTEQLIRSVLGTRASTQVTLVDGVSATEREGLKSLTPREIEVLRHIAGGLTSAAIAEQLGVSPHTVASHRRQIHRKLAVSTTPRAVALAAQSGLLA